MAKSAHRTSCFPVLVSRHGTLPKRPIAHHTVRLHAGHNQNGRGTVVVAMGTAAVAMGTVAMGTAGLIIGTAVVAMGTVWVGTGAAAAGAFFFFFKNGMLSPPV